MEKECDSQNHKIKINNVNNLILRMIFKHSFNPICREVHLLDLGDYIPEIEINYN